MTFPSFLFLQRQTSSYSAVLSQILTPDISDMQTVSFFCLCNNETLSVLPLFILTMKCIHYHSSPVSLAAALGSDGIRYVACLVQTTVDSKQITAL